MYIPPEPATLNSPATGSRTPTPMQAAIQAAGRARMEVEARLSKVGGWAGGGAGRRAGGVGWGGGWMGWGGAGWVREAQVSPSLRWPALQHPAPPLALHYPIPIAVSPHLRAGPATSPCMAAPASVIP